jgi:hypothetical protein
MFRHEHRSRSFNFKQNRANKFVAFLQDSKASSGHLEFFVTMLVSKNEQV